MRARRMVGTMLVAGLLAALAPVAAAGAGPRATTEATKDPVIIVAGTLAGQTLASVYYEPLAARLTAELRPGAGPSLGKFRPPPPRP